jgi:uncharacterized repeat protein (TIGR02543 family)
MKKSISALASLGTAVLLLLAAAGCDTTTGPGSGQGAQQNGLAAVSLAIAGTGARTVAPVNAELADVQTWKLLGTKAGGNQDILLTSADPEHETLYLETGEWAFTLEGYTASSLLILEGAIPEKTISLEGPNTLNFMVAPVSAGTGTVAITIKLPEGHGITGAKVFMDGVELELDQPLTPDPDGNVVYQAAHDAGNYFFSFRLYNQDDVPYGVVSELVKVRRNLVSEKAYTLTADDLNIIYSISYYVDGDQLSGESAKPDYYRSTDAPELPTLSRLGYNFNGWHPDAALDEGPLTEFPTPGEGEDRDFYAKWEIITYDIHYELGAEGSGNGGNPPNYTVEDLPIILQDPTLNGSFRFLYWYVEGSPGIPVTTIPVNSTEEQTFYAKWIPRHIVTIDPHNGSGPVSTTHDAGYQVYQPPEPEKSGFRFLGWFDAADGETEYEDWPYTLNADMAIHAHWKKLHRVTFDPNGGSSAGGSAALEPQDVLEGGYAVEPPGMTKALDLENLPASAGLYTGQTFGGWHVGSTAGEEWDFNDPVTEPLELYAKWTAEPVDIEDQTGDHTLAKALNYIKGLPALAEKTEYTIVLDGDSETYTMAGVTYNSPSINKANVVITLVGKGNEPTEISLTSNGALFYISAGELVLDNNITLKGIESNTYPLVYVYSSSATLTMKAGAAITDNELTNSSGGGVMINGGTFNMEGGTISGNSATSTINTNGSSGGVYVYGGTFNMSNGTISGNFASSSGGGSGGSGSGSGGGVYVSNSTFNMSGGIISGNSATNSGGGVYLYQVGAINMSGGTIAGNDATGYGGGVYLWGGTFNKTGESVIYGDDDNIAYKDNNANGNATNNTAKGAATGRGHAVYYTSGPRYRDKTLESVENISTSDTVTNWNQ